MPFEELHSVLVLPREKPSSYALAYLNVKFVEEKSRAETCSSSRFHREQGKQASQTNLIRRSTMNKAELKVYRGLLLSLRARLRGDVNQMADAALKKSRSEAVGDLSSMPIHMADIGSDNFEQEFTLSMMQSEGDTLQMIENCLERIEEGSYGQCDECSMKIPKTRLNAIPYAALCVRCAAEQENGNY
jgi:RNA polymerase-binding transcription factor DksA